MKHIKKFNEEINWPWKKQEAESDLTKNIGATKTVEPEGGQLRGVSDVKALPIQKNPLADDRIDKLFLQEISDRLYGPDSEAYVAAIEELNKKFRKRGGRVAGEFYEEERERKRSEAEQRIKSKFDDKTK